jgi:predicted enzyme related to lactoylglutathione lyase
MGERTSHAPGTFSWVDLSTTDPDGAKGFYGPLFGWEFDDQPLPDGGVYTMCHVDGKDACALAAQQEQERSVGIPPHWNNYITVASADDSASKARDVGGDVLVDPFDVMDVGRMAVIADPAGAAFCIWEPRSNIGAEIVNEPGTLTWNELASSDVDQAKTFYGDLFGWTFEDVGTAENPYTTIRNGGRMNGGVRPLGEQEKQMGVPPNWMPYFVTEDADQSGTRVGELGGKVMVGPMAILQGSRIVISQDPQGAFFALFEGETED